MGLEICNKNTGGLHRRSDLTYTIVNNKQKQTGGQRWLLVTAFVTGVVSMGVELVAVRLIAPYFGVSILVWSSLLSVVMLSLSLGYWLGGKYSQRFPTSDVLFSILFGLSLYLLLLPFLAPFMMATARAALETVHASVVIGATLNTMVLFAIPFFLCAFVQPFLVLLSTKGTAVGVSSGRILAISTIGSVVGTLIPTLFLVPWIGSRATFILFAFLLFVVSVVGLRKRWFALFFPLFVLAFWLNPRGFRSGSSYVFQDESLYSSIAVQWDDKMGYELLLDEGLGIHSLYHPARVLTGEYWDQALLAPFFQPEKQNQRVGVLGSGGGTIIRVMQEMIGDRFSFTFDGVEIDPKLIELAKHSFDANYSNVQYHAEDARVFLDNDKQGSFDLLFLDAYHHLAMPAHLTSQEFFQLVKSKLSPDGVFMVNMVAIGESSPVYQRVVATIKSVFPSVSVVYKGYPSFNYLLVATNNNDGVGRFAMAIEGLRTNSHLASLSDALKKDSRTLDEDFSVALVTDDRPLSEVFFLYMGVEREFYRLWQESGR